MQPKTELCVCLIPLMVVGEWSLVLDDVHTGKQCRKHHLLLKRTRLLERCCRKRSPIAQKTVYIIVMGRDHPRAWKAWVRDRRFPWTTTDAIAVYRALIIDHRVVFRPTLTRVVSLILLST